MILIFGGTTEGRMTVNVCDEAGKTFYCCTKTGEQDVDMFNGFRLAGAMCSEYIKTFCASHDVKCIVDAAHPFAENLHREIANVGLPVIRIERQREEERKGIVYCKDYDDAIATIPEACINAIESIKDDLNNIKENTQNSCDISDNLKNTKFENDILLMNNHTGIYELIERMNEISKMFI